MSSALAIQAQPIGYDVAEFVGDFLARSSGVLPDAAAGRVMMSVMEQLPGIIARRRTALNERNIEALVDVFLGTDPLAAAMPEIEQDNAQARADFLRQWPVLTAETVAAQAAHTSANRSLAAGRWKKARRIFSLRVSGREAYPAFQFSEGQPRKVIGRVLAALPEQFTGWQTALWFTGSNGWLSGRAPVACLGDEAALTAAAAQEGQAWLG